MTITRFGYGVVGTVAAIVIIGSVLAGMFISSAWISWIIIGFLVFLLIFTLNFFRDPERNVPNRSDCVIAPADGKVVVIKDIHDDEYIKGDAVQVSIFMSPLNVHVNRYPISGTVEHYQYFPGEFMVAFEDKASLVNERTHIGVGNGATKVLFKQIAGFVARRIVAPIKVGDRAVMGERFGMIRFGSRVDVLMPKRMQVNVQLGQMTVAGETVLAVDPSGSPMSHSKSA